MKRISKIGFWYFRMYGKTRVSVQIAVMLNSTRSPKFARQNVITRIKYSETTKKFR